MSNPLAGLSDVVHQRHRLAILTIAAETDLVEFGYLQSVLELTAGNLSRHLSVLHDAGLITLKKGFQGRRPKTWVRITRSGRKELNDEIQALHALLARHHGTNADAAGAKERPSQPATRSQPD